MNQNSPWSRECFASASCWAVAAILISGAPAWAQAQPKKKASVAVSSTGDKGVALLNSAAERGVIKGLDFLARNQHSQGAIGSGSYSDSVAVTALAGIAMLSSGSTPGEGPYGEHIERALEFVLDNTSRSGFVANTRSTAHHGPMYDHGFGTLFLAECYGMTRRPEIREKLKKAVQLIVYTQNKEGGWRYQPQRTEDADLSVTICQIMALRAARNAGIFVPKNTVDKCIEYVRKSQNADGGFRYMLPFGPSAFPRSAAGIVALYSAGVYEGKELDRGLDYLQTNAPGQRLRLSSHYFYGHYYAVQAMFQAGGDHWQKWFPAIRDELMRSARPDGSWSDSTCPEYGTAMACIILQVPNNYLPIFQR